MLRLQRGCVALYEAAAFHDEFGVEAPTLPWIAGCELMCSDLDRVRRCLERSELPTGSTGDGRLVVCAPSAIGGVFVFTDH